MLTRSHFDFFKGAKVYNSGKKNEQLLIYDDSDPLINSSTHVSYDRVF